MIKITELNSCSRSLTEIFPTVHFLYSHSRPGKSLLLGYSAMKITCNGHFSTTETNLNSHRAIATVLLLLTD